MSPESWIGAGARGETLPGDTHPEDICDMCGRHNISWFVSSDRFNAAMTALGLTSGAIVCPVCFVVGHESATGMRASWQLVPDIFRHIEGDAR